MRKVLRFASIAIGLVGAVMSAGYFACSRNPKGPSEEEIQRVFARDLPVNSDESVARDVLRKNGFEFSLHSKSSTYYGILRNTSSSGFITSDVTVEIKIKEGRVESVKVKTVYTGP